MGFIYNININYMLFLSKIRSISTNLFFKILKKYYLIIKKTFNFKMNLD
jgi:hypothetical protein